MKLKMFKKLYKMTVSFELEKAKILADFEITSRSF